MKTWFALLPIHLLLVACIPQAVTPSPNPTAPAVPVSPTASLTPRAVTEVVEAATPSGTPEQPEQRGTISTGIPDGRVHLRGGPGMHNRVIAVLPEGTTIAVLRQENDWTMVRSPAGIVGWVYSKYIDTAKGVAP